MRYTTICIVLLLTFRATADACTCMPSGPACQEYWEHEAVFVGKVTSIARSSEKSLFARRTVAFEVLETFTGVSGTRIEVHTGAGGGDCGYAFRQDEAYLVYARKDPQTGALTTGICSRTQPVTRAADDLAFLRQVKSGAPVVSRISGAIRLRDMPLSAQRIAPPSPMSGIGVIVEKDGRRFETTSGADGGFVFEGLEPGKYRPRLVLPEGYYALALPEELHVRDPRACAELDASVAFDGRVMGRVIDAGARPVGGLTVELTPRATVEKPFGAQRLRTITGRDGRYEFTRVPAGTFAIGINTEVDRNKTSNEPRVFYPGVREPREARAVELGGGERADIGDFTLPADVRYITVTGVVFDGTGVPAPGARIFIKGAAEGDTLTSVEPAMTDGAGRFTIAALEGRAYRLFAERQPKGTRGRLEVSDQLTMTVSSGMTPVTLRLKPNY